MFTDRFLPLVVELEGFLLRKRSRDNEPSCRVLIPHYYKVKWSWRDLFLTLQMQLYQCFR